MSGGSPLQEKVKKFEQENVILKLYNAIIATYNNVLEITFDITANVWLPMFTDAGNILKLRSVYGRTLVSIIGGTVVDTTLVALHKKFKGACEKQDALYKRLNYFQKVMKETKANWDAKKLPEFSEFDGKSIDEMNNFLQFWKDQKCIALRGRSAIEDLKAEWDAAELRIALMECLQGVSNMIASTPPT